MVSGILRKVTIGPSQNDYPHIKRVWFDNVEINYHNIILGDNPAVSDGAPITIEWRAHDQEVLDVDCFESLKEQQQQEQQQKQQQKQQRLCNMNFNDDNIYVSTRRKKCKNKSRRRNSTGSNDGKRNTMVSARTKSVQAMKVPVQDRAVMLLGNGYSIVQLAEITQEMELIKNQRQESAQNDERWERLNIMAESTGKVFRRLTRINLSGGNGSGSGSARTSTVRNPAA